MTITIIGAGNTATVLGRLLQQQGATILQVYSTTATHAQQLAATVGATAIDSLASMETAADLYLLSLIHI